MVCVVSSCRYFVVRARVLANRTTSNGSSADQRNFGDLMLLASCDPAWTPSEEVNAQVSSWPESHHRPRRHHWSRWSVQSFMLARL